jgi:predicted ThiF/HesA family dinucleotide-utilizing enzyme
VAAARQRFDGSDNVTIHLAGGEDLPATAEKIRTASKKPSYAIRNCRSLWTQITLIF